MKYCKTCLQPDTRPNTKFFEDTICPACHYLLITKDINWQERFDIISAELKKNIVRKTRNNFFDCIIGVSGGKDSTRQALWVRDKLKLKPLLVCLSYPPEQVNRRGTENISNLINLGFDVIWSSLSPKTWKKALKEGFFRFSNWAKSTEIALFSCVPRIAIDYKIKLIFWGENPGLQVGDLATLGKNGFDGNNVINANTLAGGNINWLFETGIPKNKLSPYSYPSIKEFKKEKLQIIFIGWLFKDWSQNNNGLYSVLNGLLIRNNNKIEKSGDLIGISSLDEDWVSLNQVIKYYKYGFGRISDQVNEEIRLGKISRDEGISIIEKYDGKCDDKYIKSFCKYIEIPYNQFWENIYKSINKKLFYIEKGIIKPKFKVGIGIL